MLTLTENAVRKIREFTAKTPGSEGKAFRVLLKAGGCSGYSYGFILDDEKEGDTVVEADGVRVVVDPKSAPFLFGCKVDYVDGLSGTGFKVENPNAKASCGCGISVAF